MWQQRCTRLCWILAIVALTYLAWMMIDAWALSPVAWGSLQDASVAEAGVGRSWSLGRP